MSSEHGSEEGRERTVNVVDRDAALKHMSVGVVRRSFSEAAPGPPPAEGEDEPAAVPLGDTSVEAAPASPEPAARPESAAEETFYEDEDFEKEASTGRVGTAPAQAARPPDEPPARHPEPEPPAEAEAPAPAPPPPPSAPAAAAAAAEEEALSEPPAAKPAAPSPRQEEKPAAPAPTPAAAAPAPAAPAPAPPSPAPAPPPPAAPSPPAEAAEAEETPPPAPAEAAPPTSKPPPAATEPAPPSPKAAPPPEPAPAEEAEPEAEPEPPVEEEEEAAAPPPPPPPPAPKAAAAPAPAKPTQAMSKSQSEPAIPRSRPETSPNPPSTSSSLPRVVNMSTASRSAATNRQLGTPGPGAYSVDSPNAWGSRGFTMLSRKVPHRSQYLYNPVGPGAYNPPLVVGEKKGNMWTTTKGHELTVRPSPVPEVGKYNPSFDAVSVSPPRQRWGTERKLQSGPSAPFLGEGSERENLGAFSPGPGVYDPKFDTSLSSTARWKFGKAPNHGIPGMSNRVIQRNMTPGPDYQPQYVSVRTQPAFKFGAAPARLDAIKDTKKVPFMGTEFASTFLGTCSPAKMYDVKDTGFETSTLGGRGANPPRQKFGKGQRFWNALDSPFHSGL